MMRNDRLLEKALSWFRYKAAFIDDADEREYYRLALTAIEQMIMYGWRDPEVELPTDTDANVVVCVSGQYRNCRFDHAYQLASYDPDDGWIVEGYEEWLDPVVHGWLECPDWEDE